MPVRAGFYWWRADAKADPKIQNVYPNMDGDLILTGGASFDWLKSLFPRMEWAGPLVPPVERPNEKLCNSPGSGASPKEKTL